MKGVLAVIGLWLVIVLALEFANGDFNDTKTDDAAIKEKIEIVALAEQSSDPIILKQAAIAKAELKAIQDNKAAADAKAIQKEKAIAQKREEKKIRTANVRNVTDAEKVRNCYYLFALLLVAYVITMGISLAVKRKSDRGF